MIDRGGTLWNRGRRRLVLVVAAAFLAAAMIAAGLVTSSDNQQSALAADATPAGVLANADLQVTKSDSPDPVASGAVLTYTIEAKNNGPDDADSVEVSDKLPGGVDFVSAATTQGSCVLKGNKVTCSLGTIPNGGTATVTLKVTAKKKSGEITNTATIEGDVADPVIGNEEDTEKTRIIETAAPTCKGKRATIIGTAGDDAGATALIGTKGADVVVGRGGDDEIRTKGGKDTVCGGKGDDDIKAGGKADKVAAGGGKDKVNAGGGADNVGGGGGPDKLIGKGGGDTLKGQDGKDVLKGNRGNDLLNGGPKKDKCRGGPGKDKLKRC